MRLMTRTLLSLMRRCSVRTAVIFGLGFGLGLIIVYVYGLGLTEDSCGTSLNGFQPVQIIADDKPVDVSRDPRDLGLFSQRYADALARGHHNCRGETPGSGLSKSKLRQLLWNVYRIVSSGWHVTRKEDAAKIQDAITQVMSQGVSLRAAGINPKHCSSWYNLRNATNDRKIKRILLWTGGTFKIFGKATWGTIEATQMCQSGVNKCVFTTDRGLLNESDAVIVHLRGVSSTSGKFPEIRPRKQPWLIYTQEPPANSIPSYRYLSKLRPYFNHSVFYSPKADVILQYGECRHLASVAMEWPTTSLSLHGLPQAMGLWAKSRNFAASKTKLIGYCGSQSKRLEYATELAKHVPVDIHGNCGNLSDHVCNYDVTCPEMLNQYKFYLAFENSLCEDYVTEQVFKTLVPDAYVVPIVLGYANYEAILPPHSYIDVRNFTSPEELAAYLKHLDANDDAYNAYFEWRKYYVCQLVSPPCTVCDALHGLSGVAHTTDIHDVFGEAQNCISPREYYKGRYVGKM